MGVCFMQQGLWFHFFDLLKGQAYIISVVLMAFRFHSLFYSLLLGLPCEPLKQASENRMLETLKNLVLCVCRE